MRLRRKPTVQRPAARPTISVVVVVYDMPKQAMNTLYTLSRSHQRDVDDVAYEVVVVENLSKRNLKARKVEGLGPEFRYIPRRETGVSPVWALREGIAAARGDIIGLMIDGARMITPGVIRNVADAYRAYPDAVVSTAGFHLGDEDHQFREHSEADDRRLLRRLPWRKDGYVLYTASTIGGGNPHGYLHPFMESNCMFVTRRALDEIGGPDVRFDQPGGGALNPDLYRELVNLPQSQLVILPGEGSFHQYHGGVTTRKDDDRDVLLGEFKQRYEEIRGEEYFSPTREPVLLGEISPYAMPMLHYAAFEGRTRFEALARRPVPMLPWDDDVVVLDREILDDPFGVHDDQGGSDVSIYLPPSLRHFFPRHIVFSTWIDHIQFGYDLVAATKPKRLVELGTQSGMSYFAFCQSVQENDLDTICYAVDTWEGEEHTGKYDESVWEMVSSVNRLNYTGFSYLMRMYFSEALNHFEDESIDLLHIDGLHTYDAVREDFETWAPKVAPGGIVLFHDIGARMKDFGVWKFWEELRQKEQDTYEFYHGFGLGVWRKPGGEPSTEPLLRYMFEGTPGEQDELRRFYVFASMYHDFRRKATGGS